MTEISEIIEKVSAYYKKKGGPESEHTIIYDSPSESLEPAYFFILDLMNDMFGGDVQKLVDNFASSPGSGHFGDMGQRATIMQQQGSKILGDINLVLKSVLNILYDLRDFRMRLKHYDDLKSGDEKTREAALLSLKQIWLDKVDITKGNSSIKAMATTQAGFVTLIDAFLVVKNEKDVDKLDLNDKVKRILRPRIQEFNTWVKESEKELRKRYEIEKAYLKSQVNSLKLYARWAKPYLKAAAELEMKETSREPALVKVFDTLLLELTLFGKKKLDVKSAAISGELPREFKKLKIKRDYYSCVLAQFKFRGIPRRIAGQSHYSFGGRAEIDFKAYALNEDEIAALEEELKKSEINDVLKLIEGATGKSLEKIQEEIDFFLNEPSQTPEKLEKKDQSNPFAALIGKYDKPKSEEEKTENSKKISVAPDNWIEKTHLRELASQKAQDLCFSMFDTYKKAHGMASYT